jgi:hypothetical protein
MHLLSKYLCHISEKLEMIPLHLCSLSPAQRFQSNPSRLPSGYLLSILYIGLLPPCTYIEASRLRPPQVPLFPYLGPELLAEEGRVGDKSARFGVNWERYFSEGYVQPQAP